MYILFSPPPFLKTEHFLIFIIFPRYFFASEKHKAKIKIVYFSQRANYFSEAVKSTIFCAVDNSNQDFFLKEINETFVFFRPNFKFANNLGSKSAKEIYF